ncbi:tRNA (adenosine(37)-N6)-methyltransferase TrmM [Pseudoalteromonas rubra]|uniref:tRNA1(Val) (adenine(37)-N6)-methyltransferase n=1 Tax=Pseudoalteromonas rubra TaxID=43658 RepID=A0A5S3WMY4_9GAMM|nr:methyltransferase [Pseudoalteromonas rubra]TMP29546.1 tRNA (adenosine(37)-N6)-methyltransferase TrmM [Pseudoalteromonas rubra]TMP35140.1 tRNA (adenosine(37)-N6)-methyltransferase TrmM [Pseudoalteromonas rubra]
MAGFAFKQFTVAQSRSAMKVSTDGVLFGAWVDVARAQRMLDIGAGTGLLSLMCKQRAPRLVIDAVEIDAQACLDATDNIHASPWPDISIHQTPIQTFISDQPYDLVISNPPYFNHSLKGPDAARNTARHTDSLSFVQLIDAFMCHSHEQGRLAVILPAQEGLAFIALAQQHGLHLARRCDVSMTPDKPVSRLMLEFHRNQTTQELHSLCVRNKMGEYSEAFIDLCRDFYLKM